MQCGSTYATCILCFAINSLNGKILVCWQLAPGTFYYTQNTALSQQTVRWAYYLQELHVNRQVLWGLP